MSPTYRQQYIRALADQEREMRDLLMGLVDRIGMQVMQVARGSDQRVPEARQRHLREAITALIIAFYLTNDFRPYGVASDGTLVPLTPFMRRLWQTVLAVAGIAQARQAAMLEQALADLPMTRRMLQAAPTPPLDEAALAVLSLSAQQFLRAYQPPQSAERADGRVLVDRIRNAAMEHARKTDGLLRELFAEGATAAVVIATLRRFFTPGALLDRLNKPYGRTGVDRAAAIWRSEPVYTFALVSKVAALYNPLVTKIVISRSHSGAEPCPICDPHVGVYEPDDTFELPGYHPHCLCYVSFETTRSGTALEPFRNGLASVRGPLHPAFVDDLLRGKL